MIEKPFFCLFHSDSKTRETVPHKIRTQTQGQTSVWDGDMKATSRITNSKHDQLSLTTSVRRNSRRALNWKHHGGCVLKQPRQHIYALPLRARAQTHTHAHTPTHTGLTLVKAALLISTVLVLSCSGWGRSPRSLRVRGWRSAQIQQCGKFRAQFFTQAEALFTSVSAVWRSISTACDCLLGGSNTVNSFKRGAQ